MPTVDCSAPQYNAPDILKLFRLCRDLVFEVLLLVLRQMRDIGHARHTHESGTRREATGTCETSQILSLSLAKFAHITSICSGTTPKHIVSLIYHVLSFELQSGVFTI